MIFKLVGGGLIIAATGFIGFLKAQEYKDRVQQLTELQTAVAQLETEIRFTQTPLTQAFFMVSHSVSGKIAHLFYTAGTNLANQTGETAAQAWEQAVDKSAGALSLVKADLEILHAFGAALGASDIEGQQKHIAATQERLSVQLEEARLSCSKNQKLFQSLGVYAGILIAILLF